MKYYVELTLLPDADMSIYFLWSKVFQQIHLALVEKKDNRDRVNIGVSFPDYRFEEGFKGLGRKLRLFAATEDVLNNLDLPYWLSRLSDYVHLKSIHSVPEKIDGYAYFKRVQTKSNLERLARRKAKHRSMTLDEAVKSFGDKKEVVSQAPFIQLSSLSSEHQFRLLITRELTDQLSSDSGFSTYGLSSNENASAVPLF